MILFMKASTFEKKIILYQRTNIEELFEIIQPFPKPQILDFFKFITSADNN